jgi:membrane protein DedA with SNARE-associated domain
MLKALVLWYQGSLDTVGYPLIALLMAMESSILPLPSEVVIPPAAHLAHTTGRFSMAGIVIAGTLGSWAGATVMYWVSRLAGRPFVLRYGRYVFITPEKVAGVERWAARFGPWGIFVSRLLPVVRHLIGIPAGIVRLNFLRYSLFTVAGSAFWCGILCWLGVKAGEDEALLAGDAKRLGLWAGAVLLALAAMYYFLVHRFMHAPHPPGAPGTRD